MSIVPISAIVCSVEFLPHNQAFPLLALLSRETREESAIQRCKWALNQRAKKYQEIAEELQELAIACQDVGQLLKLTADVILEKFQLLVWNAEYPLVNRSRMKRPKILVNQFVVRSRSLSDIPYVVRVTTPVTVDAVYRTRLQIQTHRVRQRLNVAALIY